MTGILATNSLGSSEGIQMEYTAVFLAVLFPGALVAFNHDLLQELPRFATLRIYCAGIWHNAALCVVCALTFFLLPLILYPFYVHGESPMVMDVSSESPLSGYLSPGDLIISLDGNRIHSVEEWMEMTGLLADQILQNSPYYSGGKGYCIPGSLIGERKHMQFIDNQTTCGNELMLFAKVSCTNSSTLNDSSGEDGNQEGRENLYCVTPKDVLDLKRCGDGWVNTVKDKSSCACSEGESCLTPVKLPGLTWVEITYSSPYSPGCLQLGRKLVSSDKNLNMGEISCGGTFVFIGDLISMADSVLLTSYQPRWLFAFGAYLPSVLEKLLMYTFHVSLMLALLNGLPVYYLDGESILDMALCCFSFLTPRLRDIILRSCLLGGTLISALLILRIFLGVIFVS